jgi:hypothetical protein
MYNGDGDPTHQHRGEYGVARVDTHAESTGDKVNAGNTQVQYLSDWM